VATLQFFIAWRTKKFAPGFNLWDTLPLSSMQVWAVFMLPLLITLETALLNGIEHGDRQWKHLFALPVPRYSVYFAKVIVAQALILISTFILAALIVVVGVAAISLRPELANAGPVPYGWIVKHATYVWLASWLIIAIHTWVSVRWSGFPIPLGTGHRRNFLRAVRRECGGREILSLALADEHLHRGQAHFRDRARRRGRNRRRANRLFRVRAARRPELTRTLQANSPSRGASEASRNRELNALG
jgi:hypothetical protein